MRVLGGKEQAKITFSNIALSGFKNILSNKITVTFDGETFTRNIEAQTSNLEDIIKILNDTFLWNDQKILCLELEKSVNQFVGYVNVTKSTLFPVVTLNMCKFIAYKIGFIKHHELMALSTKTANIIIDKKN